MNRRSFQSLMAIAVLVAGIAGTNHAHAGVVILSTGVGDSAYAGLTYQNFDVLTDGQTAPAYLGANGLLTSQGLADLTVSFTAGGGAKATDLPNTSQYAAPVLSGSNALYFGNDPATGQDESIYLTSGKIPGQVVLDFSTQQRTFGLLWGSIDSYNNLKFYNTVTNESFTPFTGTDAGLPATGSQAAAGTRYVTFVATGSTTFNRVIADSSEFAFEFDNVSYGVNAVPEPATAVMGLVAAGIVGLRRRMKKSKVVA